MPEVFHIHVEGEVRGKDLSGKKKGSALISKLGSPPM